MTFSFSNLTPLFTTWQHRHKSTMMCAIMTRMLVWWCADTYDDPDYYSLWLWLWLWCQLHDTTRLTNTVQDKTWQDLTKKQYNTIQKIWKQNNTILLTFQSFSRQDNKTKYVQTTTLPRLDSKHSCPSGLRGPSQERLSRDAWVRIPPDAFCFFPSTTRHSEDAPLIQKSLPTRDVDLWHTKRRGCSSDGRAFVSHTRGKGIDTPHLHFTDHADTRPHTTGHRPWGVILTVHTHACFWVMASVPEWSKGVDLSSTIVTDAWVRTPPDAF